MLCRKTLNASRGRRDSVVTRNWEEVKVPHADSDSLTKVHIETPLHPTEDPLKVKAAILNIFPDAALVESEGMIQAEASSLDHLKELFKRQIIRDTAFHVLRGSIVESGLIFSLNKQAAFVGKANFAPPSPMGAIKVTVDDRDPESVIEFLTDRRSSKERASLTRTED